MKHVRLGLVGMILVMSGCAGMQAEYYERACNEHAAYELGMNDGRAGKEMNSQGLEGCPAETRSIALKSYRTGYQDGLASTRENKARTEINVNIGGAGREKYFCQTKAFTTTFEGTGPTERDARAVALMNCKAKYHEMHCDDEIQCRRL